LLEGSNLGDDARYDQILHLPTNPNRFSNKGGTLDFYKKGKAVKALFPESKYSETQFTFQLSDHLPIWVQINTNIEGDRLNQIVQDGKKGGGS
jgi:hypothetical protein